MVEESKRQESFIVEVQRSTSPIFQTFTEGVGCTNKSLDNRDGSVIEILDEGRVVEVPTVGLGSMVITSNPKSVRKD